jgi:hypothetical protein
MAVCSVLFGGCGYSFQTSKSPLAEKEGIHKIFVAALVNNTYTPGIENTVYNALTQVISVHRRVSLVGRPEDADAILTGKVTTADFTVGPATTAQQLPPTSALNPADIRANILIATEYEATLSCSFVLTRTHPVPGKRAILWTSSFSRGAPFAGNNQLGVQGDTSALINQSEFERKLVDLAASMMGDLHESMLAMF